MKKNTYGVPIALMFMGAAQLCAQEGAKAKEKDLNITKYTVMEQYEPELVLSVDERMRLKEERMAALKRRRGILDTMKISKRRKKRLLKDLVKRPSSDRFERAVAELEFDEPEPKD